MGVKDLWKLLEPAGRPINIESLDGKVLAVGKTREIYTRSKFPTFVIRRGLSVSPRVRA